MVDFFDFLLGSPVVIGVLAERVGFEPTDEDRSSPVFKTGAFNRSATFPKKN